MYTLGFVLPFLAVGLFTGTVLDFFKSHQNVVRYTVKIGAVLLIVMGIPDPHRRHRRHLRRSGCRLRHGAGRARREQRRRGGPSGDSQEEHSGADSQEIPMVPAPDFTLTDQYGQTHTPLGLPGEDGVSELLGYLVRPLQDGDAGHPGPV